jgi:hypothetical protein
VCLAALLFLAGCGQFPQPPGQPRRDGPSERPPGLVLDPAHELELGRDAYREILNEYRGRILPKDDPRVRRCRDAASRIVRAAGIDPLIQEIRRSIKWFSVRG